MKNTTNNITYHVKTMQSVQARQTVSVFDAKRFSYPQMGVEEVVGQSSVTVSEGNKAVDAAATTQFTSDANIVEVTRLSRASVPRDLFDLNHQFNVMGIHDFLAKPFLLANGTFGTADVGTTFASYVMPNAILANVIYRNKLSGFLGFRATTVLRMVINATPFQQGRYMVAYVPYGGARTIAKNAAMAVSYAYSLVQRTQLNRIELDVSCDTEGVMRIPYDSALAFFPLASLSDANQYGALGTVQIFPYSALQVVSGTTTVSYALYASFEEVELVGAAMPQMGSLSVGEARKAGQGPVSAVLSAVAMASRALIPIPLVSSYAKTTSWALDILSNTAKAFGYCKPANLGPNVRVTQGSGYYMGNVDGFDQGISLAASSENEVKVMSGLGSTDLDEMTFDYLLSIPAWYQTFQWTTALAIGASPYNISVTPSNYYTTQTVTAQSVVNFTPLCFVANHFQYWRGSIIFKFKFVKTAFHSGRLSFDFYPEEYKSNVVSTSYAGAPYVHRQIVDIRECNEVTIEIPYVNSSPYLENANPTGYLVIHVVDPLIATGTVSTSIDILCEVSGGKDFEVAIPASGGSYTPCVGLTPQAGNVCEIVNDTIGSTSSHPAGVVMAELCVGEKIVSFRSLLKAYHPLCSASARAAAATESLVPFAISLNYYSGAAWTLAEDNGDLYTTVGSLFLYHRGGVRFKKVISTSGVYLTQSLSATSTTASGLIRRNAADYNGSQKVNPTLGRFQITDGAREKVIEISVPQYLPKHSRVIYDSTCGAINSYYYNYDNNGLGSNQYVVTAIMNAQNVVSSSTFNTANFRAGADDLQFGGFISIPPMVAVVPPTYY